MSTLALQFDQAFSIESHVDTINEHDWFEYLPQHIPQTPEMEGDFSSVAQSISTNAPSPPSTASSVASPMLPTQASEQELATKQGNSRRGSSLAKHIHQTNSGQFVNGANFGAVRHEELHIPMYAATPTAMPGLASMPQVFPQQQYIPNYNPHMPSYDAQSQSFNQAYQDVQHSYGQVYDIPANYQQGYPTAPGFNDYNTPPLTQPSTVLSGNSTPQVNAPESSRASPEVSSATGKHGRSKPRCWDHGCNGREFSTFSNLLRHQREKSGQSAKSTCPNCGAEFTRTTARNGHLLHDKCKQRRS